MWWAPNQSRPRRPSSGPTKIETPMAVKIHAMAMVAPMSKLRGRSKGTLG